MRRIGSVLILLVVLGSAPSAAAVTVELRSPEDFSGFLPASPDCRDDTPRSCRGLLLADTTTNPALRGVYVAFAITNTGPGDHPDVWVTCALAASLLHPSRPFCPHLYP